jgi:hypothetical protein
MYCTSRIHYSVVFSHRELTRIGFNPDDLTALYLITHEGEVKLQIKWDVEDIPVFYSRSGRSIVPESINEDHIYCKFVSWFYHKTGVRGYRLIHLDERITICFGHHQESVDPRKLSGYNFSGFSRDGLRCCRSQQFYVTSMNSDEFNHNPALTRFTPLVSSVHTLSNMYD